MSDAFGKITGFLLAAVLMYFIPVVFFANRQQNIAQLYIIAESTELVETVKNTGRLTRDMYETFENDVMSLGGRYSIKLARIHYEYGIDENGNYGRYEVCDYTPQLMEEMAESEKILFAENDFVYVEVRRIEKSILDKMAGLFLNDAFCCDETVSYYGGCVKNESY